MSTSPFFDVPLERLREIGSMKWSQHPGAIGAFVAEMDFGTAPAVTAAIHESVDLGLLGYLPEWLDVRMGQVWSGWAKDRYAWDVPPAWVRPLADVVAGLQVSIEHFSAPGSAVIVPTPAYMPFLVVPQALGREVVEVPMAVRDGRPGYDLDALDAAFAAGAGLLVLCNPHNPVGRVLDRQEMVDVSEVVERHGGRVFSDEVHAPLVYDGCRHLPYASVSETAARHTVTATSASKAWNLPGTKCAQLVLGNEADAETWARVGASYEHGASNLGVVANIAAYEEGGAWLDAVIEHLGGTRDLLADLLAEHLPEVGYTSPEGTYLAWLDCRGLGLGDHPAEFFLEQAGVAMIDGPACGAVGAGFVRYNFGTPRALVEQAVVQMSRALRHR